MIAGSSQPGRPPPGVTGPAVGVGVAGWVVVTGGELAVVVVVVVGAVVWVVVVGDTVGLALLAHSGAVPGSDLAHDGKLPRMSGSHPR